MLSDTQLSLNVEEKQEIERLLSLTSKSSLKLEDLWMLMDIVWDELGCNNTQLNSEKLSKFYNHPLWILVGLFTEQDEVSLQHREIVSDWIVAHQEINSVIDFGGGFGTLARMIAKKSPEAMIDIYEPYPHQAAIQKSKFYSNIKFVESLDKKYDCLVSMDVLEHVPDPIKLLSDMIQSVRYGGFLIIANCFQPVIKCHLPSTFHLRYTFDKFACEMGLEIVGNLENTHAKIYQKTDSYYLNWKKIRYMEKTSKLMFPIREFKKHYLRPIKNRLLYLAGNKKRQK